MLERLALNMEARFFDSLEWRCFSSGAVPEALMNVWTENKARREPARTDTYLLFPHARTVGVKRREGKLEVKALIDIRTDAFRLSALPGEQHWEAWEKWSLQQDGLTALMEQWTSAREVRWLAVAKARWLFYRPEDGNYPPGVQCELSQITLSGRTYWSLGLEAFPLGANALRLAVDAASGVVEPALASLSASRRREIRVMSYPKWLAELTRE